MRRITVLSSVVAILAVGPVIAQAPVKQTPIKPTPASDGKQMFDSYCATCHGTTGVGNGPAAASLKKAPADLTGINARNGGSFPEVRIKRYIEGADEIPAHGTREMPMWGNLFRDLNTNRDIAQLRIQALSDYIKSLQK